MTETMMDQYKANTIDYHPEPPRSGITSRVAPPPPTPFHPTAAFLGTGDAVCLKLGWEEMERGLLSSSILSHEPKGGQCT